MYFILTRVVGLAVHMCSQTVLLSQAVLETDVASSCSKCLLCGRFAGMEAHKCSLGFLRPVLYDCMGLAMLADHATGT